MSAQESKIGSGIPLSPPMESPMGRISRPFVKPLRLDRDTTRVQRIDGKITVRRAKNNGRSEHGIELFVTCDDDSKVVSQEELEKGVTTTRPKKRISSTYPLLWIGENYLEIAFESKADGVANLVVSSPTQITLQED